MKRKLLLAALLTFLAAAFVSGASMAWFNAKVQSPTNLFTAGTVMIAVGEGELVSGETQFTDWNPGECVEVEYAITNTGSKRAYVRARFEGAWQAAFHRNIASVNAEYSYMVNDTVYTGTVQSSSDPVYYFYEDHAATLPENEAQSNDMVEATTAKTVPEVNGLFYGDGDYLLYNLIGISASGSKLYTFIDGDTLYAAMVVDRSVNDNVFDGNPGGGNQLTDYVRSAGWNNAHRFHRLVDSEFAAFTLSCGSQTWTWQQGYADQPGGGGAGGQNYDHTQATWFSSHLAGAGSGTPPPGYVSSSSLVWNLNNYASGGSPSWDVSLGGTRTVQNWKSPFDPDYPDDVTKVDGYPPTGQITFSETYGWEWSMVYEFSVDISSCCNTCDILLSNVNTHHSPAKTGGENDPIPDSGPIPDPGIEIVKCVSIDGLANENEAKVWYCEEPWPTLPDGFAPDFKFVVTNTGNLTLTDIEVTDDVFGPIGTLDSLAPGASYEFYYTGEVYAERPYLDPGKVSIELCEGAEADWQDWQEVDGYFYYKHVLYQGDTATLCVLVCLEGSGNEYQGAEFSFNIFVEAIQATHNASQEVWGWSPP